MLTVSKLERTREHLDTFLASVRPGHVQRTEHDISYRLTEFAFILHVHQRAGSAITLAAYACFKAVHQEGPEGWLLYTPDASGHWQANSASGDAVSLAEALQAARVALGVAMKTAV